ncbi:MAG: hypothetical protein FJY92_04585, partial [Candidatus Hydrogenedentes bacterium]|nr:hypothetical protein [Candidatus Hydrogenedentota bacterium]
GPLYSFDSSSVVSDNWRDRANNRSGNTLARGDHLRVFRRGYWHHGIDCGDGTVIHYTGELFDRANAAVRRTPMAQFAKGGRVRVVKSDASFDAEAIIARAEGRLEEMRYSTVSNNCEHFATWCRTGRRESKQVRRAIAAAATLGVAVVTAAGTFAAIRAIARGRTRA